MVIGLITGVEKQQGVQQRPFFMNDRAENRKSLGQFGTGFKGKVVSRGGRLFVESQAKR